MAPDPRGATSNCHKRGWGLTPGPMLRAPLSGSWCRTAVCSQRQTPCLMVLLSGRGGGGDSEPLHLLSHRADIAHPALPPARGGAACGAAGTQCNGPSPAPRRGSCSLGRQRSAQGTAGQGQQGALQPGSSQRQGGTSHTTRHRLDSQTEASPSPDTKHGARGAGGETQMHRLPLGAPGAPRPPRWDGASHRRTLTAAGPGGLLPTVAPVQARGRGTQASWLLQDARRGPAAGRAAGGRRCPRDGPPGWHEGH